MKQNKELFSEAGNFSMLIFLIFVILSMVALSIYQHEAQMRRMIRNPIKYEKTAR